MENFEIIYGNSPIVLSAIHDGHAIREELHPYLNLKEHERSREEDPYTGYVTEIADTRIIVHTSRFEVDLNRPRNMAVYLTPKEAWGLKVWKNPPPSALIERSLEIYDSFYSSVVDMLWKVIETFGYFIVLDIHSYNHRRKNPFEEAPSISDPEINVGTSTVRPIWYPLVQDFIINLTQLTIHQHQPDVRENVKFQGGEFCRWINRNFGQYGCALAIELKKTFMDEWTGRVDIHHLNEIRQALALTLPQLKHQLAFNFSLK
jgi:N-formylglutamate amidohydrolase